MEAVNIHLRAGAFSYFQTRMNAPQVLTGVTPTLAVATLSAHTSASATKASTEMDALVSVGKEFACSTIALSMH